MKYLDYAAMGMASGAYAEASRAQDGVNQLWNEIQVLRNDINNEKYERNFQKWAEELIYQFNKTVTAISDFPANPVADCADLTSFFLIIEEYKLDTSVISGLENKEKFEKTLLRAQDLLKNLETNPQVQDYIRQQEQKQRQAEKTAKDVATARWKSIGLVSILGVSVLVFIISMFVHFKPGVAVSIAGLALFLYLLLKPDMTN